VAEPIVRVADLRVVYPRRAGLLARGGAGQVALDGVGFELMPGDTLGVAGESGSGKTTLAQVLAGLLAPTSGRVELFGRGLPAGPWPRDLRRRVQMVFQDPSSSLDPRQRVVTAVEEPLAAFFGQGPSERRRAALELLAEVGISAAQALRYPHELSGGQKQRVALARALAAGPELVILDEPTSALDVSVQAQILNLLDDLRRRRRLTFLLISHDLDVIAHVCRDVLILYRGRVMERGPVAEVFARPAHPYTRTLLAALPDPDPDRPWDPPRLPEAATGATAPGCPFRARCPVADGRCAAEDPAPTRSGERVVFCHRVEEGGG
jgi:oligopeptide/dipeptide ABC transporter ATP-binding protein